MKNLFPLREVQSFQWVTRSMRDQANHAINAISNASHQEGGVALLAFTVVEQQQNGESGFSLRIGPLPWGSSHVKYARGIETRGRGMRPPRAPDQNCEPRLLTFVHRAHYAHAPPETERAPGPFCGICFATEGRTVPGIFRGCPRPSRLF